MARKRHTVKNYFGEVLFIALAAMICCMEGFADFERFAKLKKVVAAFPQTPA